jgi:hypothetical protein
MSAAEFLVIDHALKALEPKQKVVIERNPLDFCGECQAEDEFGDFQITYRNGHEIALCRDCK